MERLATVSLSFALGWAASRYFTLRTQPISVEEEEASTVQTEPSAALLYFRENSDDDVKMVFVVRNDLKMSKGKIGAQVGHAAVDCAEQASEEEPELYEEWEECGSTKVCLKVDSEEELLAIAAACETKGLISSVIEDAGRTQIEAGSKTVCGVGPGPAGLIDSVCGHLKLL